MLTKRILAPAALASMLAIACGSPAPVAPPERVVEVAAPRERLSEVVFRLDNGLAVDLVSGACGAEVVVVVLFAVGHDHDPPDRSGMAHVIERVLSAPGSDGAPVPTVDARRDHTSYALSVPVGGLDAALDGIAARVTSLGVTDAALDLARAGVLEELAARHGGDASLTALSYASEAALPTRGNGWRRGVATEVEPINVADVDARWHAHYQAMGTRVVVVGDFDPASARTRIESAFGALGSGTTPALRDPVDASVSGTLVFGDAPTAVSVAVLAPTPSDPRYPAFLVLAARLTSSNAASRPWSASYDALAEPELFFLSGGLLPAEVPDTAAARIRGEVATLLGRPLAPSDLVAARAEFGGWLGVDDLEPARCASDARAFALARARRAQLELAALHLSEALESTTEVQLGEAAALFATNRTAAIVAGGTIR